MSDVIASKACCSSSPSMCNSIFDPLLACKSIIDMMLLPFAVAYSFVTFIEEAKADAVRTNALADLACMPSLFWIVIVPLITEDQVPIQELLGGCPRIENQLPLATASILGQPPRLFYLNLAQFAMPNLYIVPSGSEIVKKFQANIHRAMLPASTPRRNCHVTPIVSLKPGQPGLQISCQIVEHFLKLWLVI